MHQKSGTPWEKSANVFGTAFIEVSTFSQHEQLIFSVILDATVNYSYQYCALDIINLLFISVLQECLTCKTRYIRKVITPALHRRCEEEECPGKLKKTGVRYGQMVPVGPLKKAEKAAQAADLVIVLGMSRVERVCHVVMSRVERVCHVGMSRVERLLLTYTCSFTGVFY